MSSLFSHKRNLGLPWLHSASAPDVAPPKKADELPHMISGDTLDAIARDNEEIRCRFVNIVEKTNALLSLREEFTGVAEHVGKVLRDCEALHGTVVERSEMLSTLNDEHSALKTAFCTLREESAINLNDLNSHRAQVQHFDDLVQARELRIGVLEKTVAQENAHSKEILNELEFQQNEATRFEIALNHANAQLEKNDELISNLQSEVRTLTDQVGASDFHLKAVQTSLLDSQQETKTARETMIEAEHRSADLAQRLTETEFELLNRKNKIEAIEETLITTRLEYDVAKMAWQTQAESQANEIAQLKASAAEVGSRAAASEKTAGDVCSQNNSLALEIRKAERRAEEAEAKLTAHDQRIVDFGAELEELKVTLATTEKSRSSLMNRSLALVRAMKDRNASVAAAEERARLLEEKLGESTASHDALTTELRDEIRNLNEQLSKEKVARTVASKALEVAHDRLFESKALLPPDVVLQITNEADPEFTGQIAAE